MGGGGGMYCGKAADSRNPLSLRVRRPFHREWVTEWMGHIHKHSLCHTPQVEPEKNSQTGCVQCSALICFLPAAATTAVIFLQGAILLCNPRYILQTGVYAAVSPQPLTGNARARGPASGRTKATAKDEKIVFPSGRCDAICYPCERRCMLSDVNQLGWHCSFGPCKRKTALVNKLSPACYITFAQNGRVLTLIKFVIEIERVNKIKYLSLLRRGKFENIEQYFYVMIDQLKNFGLKIRAWYRFLSTQVKAAGFSKKT